jgi:hypothetical protein
VRRLLVALLLLLPACGRFGFGIFDDDDVTGDGGADGTPDRPNRAFITDDVIFGDFGGLAGADAHCMMQAQAAGLPGQFIALLSTSTVNAKDRIAGSRGWVRTDGVPLADLSTDFFLDGHLLVPFNVDATGGGPPPYSDVWTGTTNDGTYDAVNGACSDWTSQVGMGEVGFHDRSIPFATTTSFYDCASPSHLYCLEVGHNAPVAPTRTNDRFAFMSTYTTSDIGLAGFDAQCQADATAAGLPGTYLAAVGTTTQTARSRFATNSPWQRVDGTRVSKSGDAMFDGTRLVGFIDQKANGTALTDATYVIAVRTGGRPDVLPTATCNDWTTTTGNFDGGTMNSVGFDEFWGMALIPCNVTVRTLCLQE